MVMSMEVLMVLMAMAMATAMDTHASTHTDPLQQRHSACVGFRRLRKLRRLNFPLPLAMLCASPAPLYCLLAWPPRTLPQHPLRLLVAVVVAAQAQARAARLPASSLEPRPLQPAQLRCGRTRLAALAMAA